ncbi:hypothetical protein ACJMK2_022971 [Sinanodonta woodiana]|uniref:EGF-like domain-containing protein n=1 Tax=Sinanodonta woodiana TaxID=1069815 RepID=A0ABD3TMN4_SINWO
MNISNNYSYVIAFPSSIITYAIDYDPVDRVIYWVSWYRQISSGSVFGNSERTVRSLDVLAQTYGIAVDSISRLLFYTDLGNHIIAVISLVGSLHKTVISTGLTNPRDIVIDPINGSIYWADSGRPGRIEKSDYDGTNRRELVNTGLSSPYGLAVDINDGVLYWCEISTFKIQRVNVDGSNRSLIYDELVSLSYCSIALYHSYLYFTTWWSRYSIIRIGTDGRGLTYISSFVKYPHAIHVHINGRLGINGCSNGSGGCSHLCFPLPGGYRECACPDFMTLQADGKTCRQDDLPDEFILESDGTSIMRRIYINDNYSSFILPFPNWIYAYDLDYDRTNGVIYWVNGSNQINSGSIFGMNIQTVGYLNSIAQINGIAVDSISRLLFYTDLGNHIIAAVSLDDYSQKTVISSGLLSPHAIVIDQINGAIYWVDSGNPAKIEKSNYDGTNRQEIVNTGLTNPYGLQVDINAGILYWCDVSTFTIERANEDGSNRSIIYQEQVSESGCSIALYHSYIYFTAWYNRTGIMRIGTDGSGLIYVGPYALHSPRGIHVNHDAHLGSNGCTNGRGGCSHFCFPQPSGSNVCACPDFMTLQPDGKTCHFDTLPENFILVIDGSKRSIYRMDIDNYSYINIPIHNISYPNTIYYDPNDAVIFWTDSSFQQINYGSIYGNNQNTLQGFNTYAAINGTSVDVVSRLLFYTDSKQNIIGVISLDVNVTKTVISDDLNTPQAIVTDPTNGIIYWSSLNKIEKSNYDGTSRQEVIITGLDDNVDLAMDFNVYLMYWCHYSTRKIVQANMDGSNRQVLYQDQTTIYKCNIALHQSYLYYIDSSQSVLMRIATNGSGMTSIGPSIFHYVVDIHVHSNAPKNQGKNGCFNGRGGCSHFCFPQPGGSKVCDCPDDMTLQPDGLSCGKHILPERFLLILNQYYRDIYLVDIRTYRYVTIALENSYNPNAITYDPIDRNIYWTDQRFSQILSLSIDGDMKHTIRQLNRSTYPQAIAVDALSRLLFYADTEHIGVLSLEGSIHKIVISYNNTHLSVIAIDPINGTIYWTSWWINGKIEKSNYDGTNRQEIINSGLATPTGLTLDIRAGVLYWCDFSTAMLERANVDGTNRTVIYHKPGYVSLVKIALHQSHLYILGLRRRFTLMRIRTDGSNLTLFGPTQFGHNSDVVVHSNESGSLGPNGCSSRNGGCSHFCFPRPGGLKMCDCPDGLTLRTDGHTCRLHDDMCDEQPCENGAPCTNIGGLYICNCSRGWQGQKCSSGKIKSYERLTKWIKICGLYSNISIPDVDECSENPCKNRADCVNTYGSYVCNCSIGWQRQDCSDDVDECSDNPCKNSGNCVNTYGSYVCNCSIGWQGQDCSDGMGQYYCENDYNV